MDNEEKESFREIKNGNFSKFILIGRNINLWRKIKFAISNFLSPHKQFPEVNISELETKIKKSFSELEKFLNTIDPIKLLSQLTLTFQFAPENEFIDDTHDAVKWSRWIEFLGGFLLVRNYPKEANQKVDGATIERIEKLLNGYFESINKYLIFSGLSSSKREEEVIFSAKLDHLYVRGDAYPHQLYSLAKDIYGSHDKWFMDNLGFTIEDALSFSKALSQECNKRVNEIKPEYIDLAKKQANELSRENPKEYSDKEKLKMLIGASLYFGNSDKILSFTLEEAVIFSGINRSICEKILSRLSQGFSYTNSLYPHAFRDALNAPWDFNTLYEKPFINYQDKYFLPVFGILSAVLFYTFYYDLMADKNYCEIFSKSLGRLVEQKTAEYFKRVFPEEEIFLRPRTEDNKAELCDVIILHDRKIFIIQCKSKKLRLESQIEGKLNSFREDVKKGIKESFEQALRARDYLNKNHLSTIKTVNGDILIDMSQVSDIFLVTISLGRYLMASVAELDSEINIFNSKEYPWAIPLFDLDSITEIIDDPATFIHYAKRRIDIEHIDLRFFVSDELDLLGFYIEHGLYFKKEIEEKFTGIGLSGSSEIIDRYMYEKYTLKNNPEKPKQKISPNFKTLIKDIEQLKSSYKTDCIIRLLDFSSKGRENFIHFIEVAKEKTRRDHNLHSFSMESENKKTGFSFISMDANGDVERLFRQAASFAMLKKHVTKLPEWVGLGWDLESNKVVDVAVFLSYDWNSDQVIDDIAKQFLRKGKKLTFKN